MNADAPTDKVPPAEPAATSATNTRPAQIGLFVLGVIAFLYFARPVILPIVLACLASMALKPFIRWSSALKIPTAVSAATVLALLITIVVVGFIQFGRPALKWMDDAPQHMTELRQRVQKLFPPGARFGAAAAAVSNLGATEAEKKEEQKIIPTVQVKDNHGTSSVLNWTGALLTGVTETLILLYLLLASGDLFLKKLVHVMPTLSDKKLAVEISHEIQKNISHYLFSVSLINLGLGLVVGAGLYFMGVPSAAMWGMFVATLNFVPYFGPVVGMIILAIVGLLFFDTLWQGLMPAAWLFLLHNLEANLITPVLLGRRFTLNPVLIFISLMFWTWLWGVPGALLSVPILVSIKVICDRVPRLSPVSELLAK